MSEERYLRNWEKLADGTRKSTLSGFGKEIHRFEWKYGYRFDAKTKRMLSPEQLKGKRLPILTPMLRICNP
ncbi:hypothetical protein [Chryseobacterium foetidum]|uniref:hypothetical protein n=1 Tax=Chryseobacterium foetidum TaxID=2951057 RepID=UPI0021CA68AD|nr:hypothetical protein [Chryseobacterium foetidum]